MGVHGTEHFEIRRLQVGLRILVHYGKPAAFSIVKLVEMKRNRAVNSLKHANQQKLCLDLHDQKLLIRSFERWGVYVHMTVPNFLVYALHISNLAHWDLNV